MIKKIILISIAILMNLIKGQAQYCTNDSRYTEATFFDSTQITIGNNIQYGLALDYEGKPDTLKMDLYYPKLTVDLSVKRPFLLLAHGGGFSSGDKQSGDIKDLCIHMARRGFVCASINYRLGDAFSEYGQYKARYRAIQDGNAALRFIVQNANTIRIDTSWLFVGGQSAGSLLAMGMVYSDQDELDSVSLLYNPTAIGIELGNLKTSGNNLTNTYSIKGIFNNWGAISKNEVDVDEMIPTISFHGELDTTVLIHSDSSFQNYTLNGSLAIHEQLLLNNVCTELTIDKNGEHGIFRNASSVFRAQRASCFFKSIFCKNCKGLLTTDSLPSNCSIPLSLNENSNYPGLNVYPNPFENSINIEGLPGTLEINLYNCLGVLVYTNKISTRKVELDLEPGMYFLHIKQLESNQSYITKLIKE